MVHIISKVSLLVLFGEDSVESLIYRCSLSFWNLLTLFNCCYEVSGVYLSCEITLRCFYGVSGVYLSCKITLRWFLRRKVSLGAYEHVKLIIALSTMEPEMRHCPKSIVIVENEKEKKIRTYPFDFKFVVTIMHLLHDQIDNNFLDMDVQIK